MFTKVNSFWSFIGATLLLAAMYLALTHSKELKSILGGGLKSYGGFLGVVQGRTYGGVLK